MKRLYEPRTYYPRIRVFLENHRPSGPALRLSPADFGAFLKSFWLRVIWDGDGTVIGAFSGAPC